MQRHFSPNTYNTTQSKNDGDMWKFPSIPYKTTQAGIGGDFENFFSPVLHGQLADLPNGRGNFFLSPFAWHNTGDFPKCQKWTQKNRKPFLDFLSWCAVLCSGGYSVFRYGCSSKRNLNRAATSRCFMLSSVSLSICPFSIAAIRIRLL